jgi:formylmethanofuran dehydrogenase subunit E
MKDHRAKGVEAASLRASYEFYFGQRLAKDVLAQLERKPLCPRCGEPFKQWRHSLTDGEPICEPCFVIEGNRQSAQEERSYYDA